MRCAFEDEAGICHGRYSGFKCIKDRCSDYGKYLLPEEFCAYFRDGYCKKLGIFSCDGKDKSCKFFTYSLEEEDTILLK